MTENSDDDAAGAEAVRRVSDWLTTQIFELQLEAGVIDDRYFTTPSEPKTLLDLRVAYPPPPWHLRVVPEGDSNILDESQLAVIGEHPEARALRISGLTQTTFERLVTDYGAQFSAIEFEKCPRIADLSPLEDLPDLRLISFSWSQHATRLWNLARNPCLTGLMLQDFIHLHDLRDLESGASLRELDFGDALWPKSVFESLGPLAALGGLRCLAFSAKRIDDGRIEPVGELARLEALSFPPSMFTTRQVAWLRARLPDSLQSESLAPIRQFKPAFEGDNKDVLLVGKRKPLLNSARDAARIRKHVDDFRRMVDDFRHDPGLKPD